MKRKTVSNFETAEDIFENIVNSLVAKPGRSAFVMCAMQSASTRQLVDFYVEIKLVSKERYEEGMLEGQVMDGEIARDS